MTGYQAELPFVSVIVPVYNDQQRIVTCVEALRAQDYPRERYEVLVVDNGSTDDTLAAISALPVTALVEKAKRGSYAARNKALRQAKGEIIAFTDSDCTPVPGWISAGVAAIEAGADLVGGNVRFVYSRRPTGAEIYDSISNMQMEQNVRERGVATTANLFVRRAVVDALGPFPDDMASGGDIFWTRKASAYGFRIVYSADAEIAHPTRRLRELLKKQHRVGRGHWQIRRKQNGPSTAPQGETKRAAGAAKPKGFKAKLAGTLRGVRPPDMSEVRESLERHQIAAPPVRLLRVWSVAWLSQIATTVGSLSMALERKTSHLTGRKTDNEPRLYRFETARNDAQNEQTINLDDLICRSAEAALSLQAADGSFPAGQNGPYADHETPLRTTAHWLITLLRAHELTGDPVLRVAARRAATYLARAEARPMGATFLARRQPERDFCNGLIGQAWVIEALVTAAEKLEEPRYRELAREVFLLHPFDQKTGLWRSVNVEGSYGPFDMAFNHQLWFAASGALIDASSTSEIGSQVRRFLYQTLRSHLKIDLSGRINHFVPAPRRSRMRRIVGKAIQPLRRLRRKPSTIQKEIGYHAFNLYAFALLKQQIPDHPLWKDAKFAEALHFVTTPEYRRGLETSRFGFPYNPPGFEVAFAMQTFPEHFKNATHSASWWVEQQIRHCYDLQTNMMDRQTSDGPTLAARLYEATRLRQIELQLGWHEALTEESPLAIAVNGTQAYEHNNG